MPDVVIYSKPVCPYCTRAKDLLASKGCTDYKIVDVSESDEARDQMIERSGGRKTVPQVFINGSHIGGFDDLTALDREGKLDPLLR